MMTDADRMKRSEYYRDPVERPTTIIQSFASITTSEYLDNVLRNELYRFRKFTSSLQKVIKQRHQSPAFRVCCALVTPSTCGKTLFGKK